MRAVYTAEIYYCAGFSSLLPTLSSEMATAFLTSCGPATIVVVQATDDPHEYTIHSGVIKPEILQPLAAVHAVHGRSGDLTVTETLPPSNPGLVLLLVLVCGTVLCTEK